MSQIILDFGSANTCHNDKAYIKRMYDELKAVDTGKHEIICKWQLFEKAGENISLQQLRFDYAYEYGTSLGYKVTSSVFDKNSLDFLLEYDPCFVKIANNRNLDWLIGEVPRKIPVYISYSDTTHIEDIRKYNLTPLLCVSKYPAEISEYENAFSCDLLRQCYGISDHTTNFGLWYRYQPKIIEWHYGLQDSTGLDAGSFMKTPEMLREVL